MRKSSGWINEEDVEYQEYVSEIWLQICEVEQEKWTDLFNQGKIKAYVSGLVYRNVKSVNSPAYWHVRRQNSRYVHRTDKEWFNYEDSNNIGYLCIDDEEQVYD